jgi:hypothetical protein
MLSSEVNTISGGVGVETHRHHRHDAGLASARENVVAVIPVLPHSEMGVSIYQDATSAIGRAA